VSILDDAVRALVDARLRELGLLPDEAPARPARPISDLARMRARTALAKLGVTLPDAKCGR
jgi:hypothetical protein